MMYQIDKVMLRIKEIPEANPVKNKPGKVTIGRSCQPKNGFIMYYAATKEEADAKLREYLTHKIEGLKYDLIQYEQRLTAVRNGIAALEDLSLS
jgi:hypothetical protein